DYYCQTWDTGIVSF
nr:immunoglobulin light chain junction region [Macaca mulatta]MOV66230.1 immunoglobulin light chain junction region [Macaca mulatta]MOV66328.1 immunoglobulin light chain junction region [Macaca mulatta]MOV66418.1 immunoglobulin light chain junction region [Macaca mulatta]MOV67084.1 immunoglobulin light chain junction region [Macaca mulatta]